MLCVDPFADLKGADLPQARGLKPTIDPFRQGATLARGGVNRHVTNQASRDIHFLQLKACAHLKASWVEALWCDQYLQLVTAMDRSGKIGFAMHHGQGDCWGALLISAAREDGAGGNSIALQACLPGFMAPAQNLVEMHHSCCVGVSKAHHLLQA